MDLKVWNKRKKVIAIIKLLNRHPFNWCLLYARMHGRFLHLANTVGVVVKNELCCQM